MNIHGSPPQERREPVQDLGSTSGRPPETVSRWASRGATLRQDSSEFRSEYEELDRALAEEASEP